MSKPKTVQGKTGPAFDEVPEELVPIELKKDGRFLSGGYKCRECAFATSRFGFSGRQALRAHLKVHTLERRAWARPMVF